MRFLADMGLGRSTVAFLRAQGYDAVHLRDEGLQRLSDVEIVKKAVAEGRVVLTHDLDFGRIVAMSGATVPSVITFRLQDMRPARVNHYLAQVLAEFTPQLEDGALVSVNEQNIRVRSLPIESRGQADRRS
jgi:predicted nuclease of predicted toxin-antitoxin system